MSGSGHCFIHHCRFLITTTQRETRRALSSNNTSNRKKSSPGYSANQSILGTIPKYGVGLEVGQFAELHRSFLQHDVNTFGALISDMNPVHFPGENAAHIVANNHLDNATTFKQPIVHGMLLSSLFSAIFGTLIPGAIYRKQYLKFNNPVFVGEEVVGRVIIRKLRHINRNGIGVLCMCDTVVARSRELPTVHELSNDDSNDEVTAISGEAQVWLPGATVKKISSNPSSIRNSDSALPDSQC